MSWHAAIPWGWVQHAYRSFRRRWFTRNRPEYHEYVVVPPDIDGLVPVERTVYGVLGPEGFAPNWEFSYNYRGEDLNIARVFYDRREVDGDPYAWWQDHVRGWVHHDGSIWLTGHRELEPTEHPHGHLDAVGWSKDETMNRIIALFERENIDISVKRWPNDAVREDGGVGTTTAGP